MKIIFICGSLEPGRDGVGDYTRRLAGELLRQGHSVAALALNDAYIQGSILTTQEQNGVCIPVLRLGVNQSSDDRFIRAKKWIDQLNPEWLSLQFVPFSFQEKGLPWRLGNQLAKLGKGRKWHIMFHELWVESTDIKSKLLSFLQQSILTNLALKINPVVLHTNLPVYKSRLGKAGIKVKKLPIFSNLSGADFDKNAESHVFKIAFFSQFTPRKSVNSFLENLTKEVLLEGLDFRILLIGGGLQPQEKFNNQIKRIPGVKNKIILAGFLEEDKLLEVINNCDLGITPVPRHVLGKSGSVAAFLSQGIPVAAPYEKPGYESLEIGFFNQSMCAAILTSPKFSDYKISAIAAKAIPGKLNVSSIANKFISKLVKKS